jgi:hypothetical protein
MSSSSSPSVSSSDLSVMTRTLKEIYYSQLSSEVVQRDVIFECACGLLASEEAELAAEIFEDLISSGFLVQECRLHLSKAYWHSGLYVKARQVLNQLLAEDPENEEAKEFKKQFDADVRKEGKFAIYGLLGVGALIALYFGWRRTQASGGKS